MRVAASIGFVWMLGVAVACEAIDNPDAPDFVVEFNARAKKYEDIRSKAMATEDVRQAYADYISPLPEGEGKVRERAGIGGRSSTRSVVPRS